MNNPSIPDASSDRLINKKNIRLSSSLPIETVSHRLHMSQYFPLPALLLLLLFHTRCPAAPAPLPALPDDADRRCQCKEKRRALAWKPSSLASCYD
jgi:hypothetical protein